MPFDINTARPVVSSGINMPVDPLKRKGDLADLALKYQQLENAKLTAAKAAKASPTYGQVSEGEAAKTYGREVGKYRAAAQQSLPGAVSAAKATTAHIKKLLEHPGFSAVVGMPNPFKGGFGVATAPGSRARGAESLLKQIQGTAFLSGVQAMKGTGPVSEREGKAAEAAIQRMSKALSEDEFKEAAQEYVDAMERGIAAMRANAAMPVNAPVAVSSPDEKE